MKLRIRNNSIRLRLTQTEVGRFLADGRVVAVTEFPDGATLEYALVSDDAVGGLTATMRDGSITVRAPADEAREWAGSDRVSLSAGPAADGGQPLALLVEKDFACLAPREGEDESDMYPHPEAGAN